MSNSQPLPYVFGSTTHFVVCSKEFMIAKDVSKKIGKLFLKFIKESELETDQLQTHGALKETNCRPMVLRQERFQTKQTIYYPH